jgi:hypothetical protein
LAKATRRPAPRIDLISSPHPLTPASTDARIDDPPQYAREDRTFKKAPKAKRGDFQQKSLPMVAEPKRGYGE